MIDSARETAMRPARVAVVDDDSSVRRALLRLLLVSGYEAVGYASAEEFLEEPQPADCLLLDIQLGGMSGLELQRLLETRAVAMPIIFLTAHGTSEARERAQQAANVSFFEKPIPGKALLAAVRAALERSRSNPGQRPGV